jgi:hypothetical protein
MSQDLLMLLFIGSLADAPRVLDNSLISDEHLIQINYMILGSREITSSAIKREFNLGASERTIQYYIYLIGWRYRRNR